MKNSAQRPKLALGALLLMASLAFVIIRLTHAPKPSPQSPQGTTSLVAASDQAGRTTPKTKPDPETRQNILQSVEQQSLRFEANQGQSDPQVKYLSHTSTYDLFLTPTEAVVLLKKSSERDAATRKLQSTVKGTGHTTVSATLRTRLVGGNPEPKVVGLGMLPGRTNYYIGNNPEKWRTHVPHFESVKYEAVYPGTDLIYHGSQKQLEYDFQLAPAADPTIITLDFDGTQSLSLNAKGDLVLHFDEAELVQYKPKAYQEIDSRKVEVACQYQIKGERSVGFELGAYDKSKPLVIDPVIVGYATYLGGSQGEAATSIAIDSQGFTYITGTVTSFDFPATIGARHDTFWEDVFITKFMTDGSSLEYSTILGGIYGDDGYGIAVDKDYSAYVVGPTSSPDYPLVNAFQSSGGSSNGNATTAFLTKLRADGTIDFSTYFGNGNTGGEAVALDKTGNIFFVGTTRSSIPIANGFQSSRGGVQDGYLAEFAPTGTNLLYSTYIGGTGGDRSAAVATDPAGAGIVSVTGLSLSPDFPTSPSAYRSSGNGYAIRLDTNKAGSNSVIFATKLADVGKGVAVDNFGNTFVGTATLNSGVGSKVVKLSPGGTTALFTTSNSGSITALALDSGGNAYITGSIQLGAGMLATSDAFQLGPGGGILDGFVQKLKASNGTVLYSSFFGGNNDDYGLGIALDNGGNPYIAGGTRSRDFPVTPNAFQSTNHSLGQFNPVQAIVLKIPDNSPVIFIPGISGSYLYDGDFGNQLWPGLPTPITPHGWLTLDPNKTQHRIVATDAIRTVLLPDWVTSTHPLLRSLVVYSPLIGMLTDPDRGGYVEYVVNGDENKRTAAGCDDFQQPNNPKLFVFAYDWRLSNETNAGKLKDYVQCVHQFYPDQEINIVTHSMGGVVARRYIMGNPDTHGIKKLITLSFPATGTPKSIMALETGDVDFPILTPKEVRELTEFFPSTHELVPSQGYFDLANERVDLFGSPFAENGWDVNQNGQSVEEYTYEDLVSMLNLRHPTSTPGSINRTFHEAEGNDNWRNDKSGVIYHHIIGEQLRKNTIANVIAEGADILCDANGRCSQEVRMIPLWSLGDGTVAAPSLERGVFSATNNMNAPGARTWLNWQQPGEDEHFFEHTGLTQSPRVLALVQYLLGRGRQPNYPDIINPPSQQSGANESFGTNAAADSGGQQAGTNAQASGNASSPAPITESYYLTVSGGSYVTITDAFGNSNELLGDSMRLPVPNVGAATLNDRSVMFSLPVDQTFTVTFRSGNGPIAIEIVKGIDTRTLSEAKRYRDVNLPPNLAVKLSITPTGVSDLLVDSNNDGSYATVVPPAYSTSGTAVGDVTPPTISFAETIQGTNSLITIQASDSGSGVREVKYSTDGQNFHHYDGPLLLDPNQIRTIYAFADDNVGNRSSLASHELSRKIAFETTRDGNPEIYVMNADGSNQTNVTNNPGDDYNPDWSPDGKKIAFDSDREDVVNFVSGIYVMNADGTNPTKLTNNPDGDKNPIWSPDGTKIAYLSYLDNNNEIVVMNADGSNQRRLTFNPRSDQAQRWSPDGSKLVYESWNASGGSSICVINADGSGLTQLTDHFVASNPVWSPNGQKIAFVDYLNSQSSPRIATIKPDGSNLTYLTPATSLALDPAWSPNGAKIAFMDTRDYSSTGFTSEIYVMNADGSQQSRLTNNTINDRSPMWSPDGQRVGYLGDPNNDGKYDIFLIGATSNSQTNLTNTPAPEYNFRWQVLSILPTPTPTPTPTPSPSATPTPTPADITVGAFASPNFVATGGHVNYTVYVTNLGPGVAANTMLTSQFPAGVALDTISDAAGGSCGIASDGVNFNCTFASFNPLETRTVLVMATSNIAGAPYTPVTTSFTVTSDTPDNNPANNTGSIEFLIAAPPLPTPTPGPADDAQFAYTFFDLSTSQNDIFRRRADGTGQLSMAGSSSDERDFVWAPDGSKLAYVRYTYGATPNADIFVVNADGTNLVQLTNTVSEYDVEPAWSQDGTRLAFVSRTPAGDFAVVHTIKADGSDLRTFSPSDVFDSEPSFSPDGARVSFVRRSYVTPDTLSSGYIYVVNADGTNPIRLDHTADVWDMSVKWSPDSSRVAFNRVPVSGPTPSEIYSVRADGTDLRNLTNNSSGNSGSQQWSPNGALIAFVHDNVSLQVMGADGSNRHTVYNAVGGGVTAPVWSPDGTKLAFWTQFAEASQGDVYVVNADGSSLVHIGDDRERNASPDWSPDGQRLVFQTSRNGVDGINVVNADGTNRLELTNATGFYGTPKWRPVPQGNTPAGANISVTQNGVTVTFSTVTSRGETTITPIDSGSLSGVPGEYVVNSNSLAFDIHTTAVYSGSITIGFQVPAVNDPNTFSALRVLHSEPPAVPNFVDRTVLAPDTPAPNFATRTIYARINSLSPFLITEKLSNLMTALGPAQVWVGLKNSDDVGTKFDLLAEVFRNGTLVGSGQINDVAGGSSGFNNARLNAIALALSGAPAFGPGTILSFRLSVRIAASSGHHSGTARLWFNDTAANSRFSTTIGGVANNYYLKKSGTALVLAGSTGGTTKVTVDVSVDRAVGGNPFKPFGTWALTF